MIRKARRASQSPIPYWDSRVTFIWRDRSMYGTHLKFAVSREDKFDLLHNRRRKIYVAWPGEKETHLFVIDNTEMAYKALATQTPQWDDPKAEINNDLAEERTWD